MLERPYHLEGVVVGVLVGQELRPVKQTPTANSTPYNPYCISIAQKAGRNEAVVNRLDKSALDSASLFSTYLSGIVSLFPEENLSQHS